MFLDDEELCKLAGVSIKLSKVRRNEQIRTALDRLNVRYELNVKNEVIVSRAYIDQRLGYTASNDTPPFVAEPNLSAIR